MTPAGSTKQTACETTGKSSAIAIRAAFIFITPAC
ncbi:hypothetical protein PQA64_gp19 [Burkholderia phage PhiBP82.2]|nr:hypothetical protein PQA64_gp19 [Burkholderia phage PhiBP82.2]UKM53778.1 hypothetical protein PhiBP822_20 [Burkholderia phage PhiBP82.2]